MLIYVCTAQNRTWLLIGRIDSVHHSDRERLRKSLEGGGYGVQFLRVDEALARNLPIAMNEQINQLTNEVSNYDYTQ